MKQLLLAGVALLCLTTGSRAQSEGAILPAKWRPELTEMVEQTESALANAETQTQMNGLSRNLADLKDAQLFVLYVQLYEKLLPAKGREALAAEQARWLKARTRAAKSAVESEGGSMAALEANGAEAAYTDKRLRDLTSRLTAAAKSDPDE